MKMRVKLSKAVLAHHTGRLEHEVNYWWYLGVFSTDSLVRWRSFSAVSWHMTLVPLAKEVPEMIIKLSVKNTHSPALLVPPAVDLVRWSTGVMCQDHTSLSLVCIFMTQFDNLQQRGCEVLSASITY